MLLAAAALAGAVAAAVALRTGLRGLQSDLAGPRADLPATVVALAYALSALAVLALPVGIAAWTVARRSWRLLGAYVLAVLATSTTYALLPAAELEPAAPPRDPAAGWPVLVGDTAAVVDPRSLAAVAAVLTVSGPRLPTRWRRWAWLVLAGVVVLRGLAVGVVPAGSVAAVAVGGLVGAVVLLAAGSPARRPAPGAVVAALHGRGFPVDRLRPAASVTGIGASYDATTPDGRALVVRVFGRDDRRAETLAQLGRWVTTRGPGDVRPYSSLRRAVEHEALLGLLVERAGVATPALRAIVSLDGDDAMVLVCDALDGAPLDGSAPGPVDAAFLQRTWAMLARLREARIAHGDLQLAALVRLRDGRPALDGFAAAQDAAGADDLDRDVAQLLLTLALVADPPDVVAAAVAALGAPAVAAAAPLLQPAALPARTRTTVHARRGLLERVQHEVARQTGSPRSSSPRCGASPRARSSRSCSSPQRRTSCSPSSASCPSSPSRSGPPTGGSRAWRQSSPRSRTSARPSRSGAASTAGCRSAGSASCSSRAPSPTS